MREDFADYDGLDSAVLSCLEDAGEAVSVMNIEWKFE